MAVEETTTEDRDLIIAAATDYAESWLNGDAARMASCLHPSLAKRAVADADSGALELDEAPFTHMTGAAVAGGPKPYGRELDIAVLDLVDGIATARVVSEPFIDLLHLARFGDRWLIVNAVYQDRTDGAAAGDPAGPTRAMDGYVSSWFDRDPERTRDAVHPALAERRVLDAASGSLDLDENTFEELLEFAAEGPDEPVERRWTTEVLSTHPDIAAGRVVALWWDICLHLARFGDRWLIVNILDRSTWESA